MENQKIILVGEKLKDKQIPFIMLKNRTLDQTKTVDELVGEIENDFTHIKNFIDTGRQAETEAMLQSLKDWSKKE